MFRISNDPYAENNNNNKKKKKKKKKKHTKLRW